MKALTLWQPWASAVADGVKTIETRPWATRYRGRLAIHAAARCIDYDRAPAVWDAVGRRHVPLGAVVATCRVADVLPIVGAGYHGAEPCIEADTGRLTERRVNYWAGGMDERDRTDQLPLGDFTPGRFAWLLTDVTPLREPVAVTGRQKLWNWTRA